MLNGFRIANVGHHDPVLMLAYSYYEDSTQGFCSSFQMHICLPQVLHRRGESGESPECKPHTVRVACVGVLLFRSPYIWNHLHLP